jgi:DNA-binding beta-propeller fold protein YncE
MKIWTLCVLVILAFASCKKDPEVIEPVAPLYVGENVLVLNEGNFQWGNSSTTWINYVKNTVNQNAFASLNERPLGDVLNSATKTNDFTYLIVNNSGKVERMKSPLDKAVEPIVGFHSPRYVLPVSSSKLYVSDLYENKIYIVNSQGQHIGSINFSGWSEQMIISPDNAVWVCNVTRGNLVKINPQTDQITDSISVGDSPMSMHFDKNNMLWVLCEGKVYPNETAGSLWCVNLNNGSVVKSFVFGINQHPKRLQKSSDGNTIYYLLDGVRKMQADDIEAPNSAFISQGSKFFYGLGIDSENKIWVSDAKDFVQNGEVLRYSAEGVLISSFEAGIIPSGFVFY